ncbi:MAG: hypothetical protein HUU02_07690 [Bacteroidetes bacterium]|nr:hypothetical protein [Bacteroidota bacterium]
MRSDLRYIALCSLLLLSCNLFDTRDPENPVTDNQTLPTPFTADILFSNFRTSVGQMNIAEYEKLFSDTAAHPQLFRYVPHQSAAARYASVFSGWNRTMEHEYFRKVISSVGTASSVQFQVTSAPQIVTFQSDSAVYTFDYLLFIPHTRTDVALQQFAGRAEIAMAPDRNPPVWRIYRWTDFETRKDSSWSELKGQFAK